MENTNTTPATVAQPSTPRLYPAGIELLDVMRRWEQWGVLAWADTKFRYRRTTLGPSWITLSLAATIFSVGILYGTILGGDLSQYLPYFAVGMIVWNYLSSSITEGCLVFIQASSLITSIPVPLVLNVYRMLAGALIVLAHNAVLIVFLWLIFRWPIGWVTLLAIPGLVLASLALLGIILTCAIVCTRFRDLHQIVSNVLQLLFFLTPIIWLPSSLRGDQLRFFIHLNPFYYLIEVVRGPLLGVAPDIIIWVVVGSIALAMLAMGTVFYMRFRHRVAFWL
jgi:ABC-type polysaccharide/polyol phosphate export permease